MIFTATHLWYCKSKKKKKISPVNYFLQMFTFLCKGAQLSEHCFATKYLRKEYDFIEFVLLMCKNTQGSSLIYLSNRPKMENKKATLAPDLQVADSALSTITVPTGAPLQWKDLSLVTRLGDIVSCYISNQQSV